MTRIHPDDIEAIAESMRIAVRDELERATSSGPVRISPLPGGCDFCRLSKEFVRMLIIGRHNVAICNECVASAAREIVGHTPTEIASLPAVLPGDLTDGRFVRSRDVDRYGGLVYAIALIPDIDVRRIKIGYTTRPIDIRIEAFRTANPTASLLGLWTAPSEGELVAHGSIHGRIGNSEVFDVKDVVSAISTIDEEMRRRWP